MVRLFWTTNNWAWQDCKDIEHAYDMLQSLKRSKLVTHWAIAPIKMCDGGITPPPKAIIHKVK